MKSVSFSFATCKLHNRQNIFLQVQVSIDLFRWRVRGPGGFIPALWRIIHVGDIFLLIFYGKKELYRYMIPVEIATWPSMNVTWKISDNKVQASSIYFGAWPIRQNFEIGSFFSFFFFKVTKKKKIKVIFFK